MMYSLEQGIKVNEFGKGKRDLTWAEFFTIVREIFGQDIDGSRTYRKHFGGGNEQKQEAGSGEKESGRQSERRTGGTQADGRSERERKQAQTGTGGAEKPAGHASDHEKSGRSEKSLQDKPERQETGKQEHMEPEPGEREHSAPGAGGTGDTESTEPPETEFAPAQKTVKSGQIRAERVTLEDEQLPGQMNITDYPEIIPAPADAGKAVWSRREYLKTRNTYELVLILAAAVSKTEYDRLTEADFWDRWLRAEVDEEGETV